MRNGADSKGADDVPDDVLARFAPVLLGPLVELCKVVYRLCRIVQ